MQHSANSDPGQTKHTSPCRHLQPLWATNTNGTPCEAATSARAALTLSLSHNIHMRQMQQSAQQGQDQQSVTAAITLKPTLAAAATLGGVGHKNPDGQAAAQLHCMAQKPSTGCDRVADIKLHTRARHFITVGAARCALQSAAETRRAATVFCALPRR
jgi:hypothetical protein